LPPPNCAEGVRSTVARGSIAVSPYISTMTFELGDRFESHADAKTKLFDYIEVFYNHERRHSTLGT
jgi:transposase InsO family protein